MTLASRRWWQRTFDGSLASVMGISGGSVFTSTSTSDAVLAADLDRVASLGVRWVRGDWDWSAIQPTGPSSYTWTTRDRLATYCRARSLMVLGIITYTPSWANGGFGDNKYLPTDMAAWETFCGACAARYGSKAADASLRGTVRVWEIWNEPNHGPFAKPNPDPAKYADMLLRANRAIKAADPDALVIAGGTAPAPQTPPTSYSPPGWYFDLIFTRGSLDHCDAVAHHPYAYPFHFAHDAEWNSVRQTRQIDALIRAAGRRHKIWSTEAGLPTPPSGAAGVSEAEQAFRGEQYLRFWFDAYAAFAGPWMWYSLRDLATGGTDVENNFGLWRTDGTAKPAAAMVERVARLGVART